MTQERPGDNFGDSYLGGDDEDFDTLKSSGNQDDYTTEVSDGNSTDWETTYNLAIDVSKDAASNNSSYFELQGLNSSGVRDTNLPVYLDVDNLIDYHLLIFYSGFFDGPLSAFNPIAASNNWFGVRNRTRDDRGLDLFNSRRRTQSGILAQQHRRSHRTDLGRHRGSTRKPRTLQPAIHPSISRQQQRV